MDRFAYMQSLQPQPTPEKKAYTLDFTQDEIILLYNCFRCLPERHSDFHKLCLTDTGFPELDDLICGCENVRRKIFLSSGLS